MDINLKNYDSQSIKIYSDRFLIGETRKVNSQFLNYDFIQIVNLLKINQILSPHEKYKVNVNFENFSDFRQFIFNTKKNIHNFLNKVKLISSNYPESSWSVDFKNSIHITNNIYSTKTSFTEYLNKKLTANEVLIYTFLHELGHCVHSHLKNKTKLNFSSENNLTENIKNFLNDSIPFKDVNSLSTSSYNSNVQKELEKDLSLASHYGMKEGFADLYACVAVSLIYPKAQAENIISHIVKGREYSDKWNQEFYYSKNSVQLFLNDFQNKKIQFNNFSDIQKYIEKTTAHTIVTTLQQQINSEQSNDNFVNHYFGVLKNKLKPDNCSSLKDMIHYINHNYDLGLNQRQENDFFILGFNSSNKASPNPQISSSPEKLKSLSFNIRNLRKQFIENDKSFQSKNKI